MQELIDKLYPGYKQIPGFSNYAINEEGVIINIRTGRQMTYNVIKSSKESITGGYYRVRLINDDGVSTSVSRHRTLMTVFRHPGYDITKMVVNHKDGVPGNDTLDNLEWCTYSENTKHAYDNGLHPEKVVSIIAWHVPTGEFTVYKTLEEAASATGFKPVSLRRRTYPPRNTKYYEDGWLFKENDGSEWPEIEDRTYTSLGLKYILAMNIYTKEVVLYENKLRAAEALGIDMQGVVRHSRLKSVNPLHDHWFREVDTTVDNVEFPVFEEIDIKRYEAGLRFEGSYPELTFPDGRVVKYISYEEAGKEIGYGPLAVERLCKGVSRNRLGITGRIIKPVLITKKLCETVPFTGNCN